MSAPSLTKESLLLEPAATGVTLDSHVTGA